MNRLAAASESDTNAQRAASVVRVALARAQNMIGYAAVFAASLGGYAGLGVWAIAVTATALASLSYAENGHLHRRSQELGLVSLSQSVVLRSVANALMATGAAYAVGWIFRLL